MNEKKKIIDNLLLNLNEAIADRDFYMINSLNLILSKKFNEESNEIHEIIIKRDRNTINIKHDKNQEKK